MSDTHTVAGLVEQKTLQKQVLAQVESLPSLSMVVGEFLELSNRDYFTAMDFEKVLIKDQALVARLLKVANSSFFGSSKPIQTVHEAIVLIGMDNMKNIVYAVSSSGLLRRAMKNYRYPEQGFWLHSMAVGMMSRALTEGLKDRPIGGEAAFVAGLLHDIGKLIIDDFLDSEQGRRTVTLEEERYGAGFDHTELAEHILDRWKIPGHISEAIRHHHDYKPEGELNAAAAVIHLADKLCNAWGVGTQTLMDLGADVNVEDHADVLEALNLDKPTFESMLWELRQKLPAIENYYSEEA